MIATSAARRADERGVDGSRRPASPRARRDRFPRGPRGVSAATRARPPAPARPPATAHSPASTRRLGPNAISTTLQVAGHAPGGAERGADLRLPQVLAVARGAAAAVVALGEDEASGLVERESHPGAASRWSWRCRHRRRGPGWPRACSSPERRRSRYGASTPAGSSSRVGPAGRSTGAQPVTRTGRPASRSSMVPSARRRRWRLATVPSSTQSRLRAPVRGTRAVVSVPRISAIPTARRSRASGVSPSAARISSRNRRPVSGAGQRDGVVHDIDRRRRRTVRDHAHAGRRDGRQGPDRA